MVAISGVSKFSLPYTTIAMCREALFSHSHRIHIVAVQWLLRRLHWHHSVKAAPLPLPTTVPWCELLSNTYRYSHEVSNTVISASVCSQPWDDGTAVHHLSLLCQCRPISLSCNATLLTQTTRQTDCDCPFRLSCTYTSTVFLWYRSCPITCGSVCVVCMPTTRESSIFSEADNSIEKY